MRCGSDRTFRNCYTLAEGLSEDGAGPFCYPSCGVVDSETRITSDTGGEKGQKLARVGSLDPLALLEVAKVAGFGERKYDRLNYMRGYDWSLSFDAGMRHRLTHWSGEERDPESGLYHLAHSAWHDLTQLAFLIHELGTDDRFKGFASE